MAFSIQIAKRGKNKQKNPANQEYPTKSAFRNEGDIETFPNKQKLSQYIIPRPAYKKSWKEFLKLKQKDIN